MGEGAGRGFTGHGGVDGEADGWIDIKEDDFFPITQKDGAACFCGHEGEYFNPNQIWHG